MQPSPFAKLEAGQAPTDGILPDLNISGLLLTGKDVSASKRGSMIRSILRGGFHVALWIGACIAQFVIAGDFGDDESDAQKIKNKTGGLYSKHFDFPKDGLNDLHRPMALYSAFSTLFAFIVIAVISAFWKNSQVKTHAFSQFMLLAGTLAAAFASAVQVYFLTMTATALKYDKDGSEPNAQDGETNDYFLLSLWATFLTLGAMMTLYSYAATEFEHEMFVPSLAWGFSLVFSRILQSGYEEYATDSARPEPDGVTWEHTKAMADWLLGLNTGYVILSFVAKYFDTSKMTVSYYKTVDKNTGPLVRSVFFTCSVVTLTLSGILYNFAANEWTANSLGTSKWFSSGGRIIALVILALQFSLMQKQMDASLAKTKQAEMQAEMQAGTPAEESQS